MCEPKRRWVNRDTQEARFGLMAFQHFYKITGQKKVPSYDTFQKSQMYKAFVSFGKYFIEIDPVNGLAFVDYLVKHSVPIRDWEKPSIYAAFIRELNKRETVDAALVRHFNLAKSWSEENGVPVKDFFRSISTQRAVMWITSGRITPWILLNCESGQELLGRMTEEQVNIVMDTVDPNFWRAKFNVNRAEADALRDELKELGL